MLRGVIFDLDGTLVESYLDFDRMRAEMDLPPGVPILETLATLPAERVAHCWKILERHEMQGVERAELIPGIPELLAILKQKQVRTAVFTRNSRGCTLATLERFSLTFDTVLSRDDAPPKPDPQGVFDICRQWNLRPAETAVVGDYVFDLRAGRAASARTVLFARGNTPEQIAAWTPEADLILHDFTEPGPLLDWLVESI